MRHKRIITLSIAAFVLVSLCAVCASTSVTAKDSGGAPSNGLDAGPAVCSWGAGRLDVFSRGTDDNLWHTWWDGSWHNWENLGSPSGGLASAPSAVSWGAGRIDVIARGSNGDLIHKWFDNGWSGWESLGVPKPGANYYEWVIVQQDTAPAACSWGPGRLDIFIMGSDYDLWHKWFSASNGWQAWESLGRSSYGLGGSPGAVATTSWGYPRVDVFVRGQDGALWQKWWGNGWQPWHRFDDTVGLLASWPTPPSPTPMNYFGYCDYAPAVCSWGANRLDVFFVDTNWHLQQKWFDGSWHDLYQVGGTNKLTASPSAVAWKLGSTTRIDIFSRGLAFNLWQLYYAGGWHGWYNLGFIGSM